jgi:transcriptional regulator with XRE-family HTH domain
MESSKRITRQTGAALRRIRLDRGIGEHALALHAGITPQVLSSYEQGKELPPADTLALLLSALDCSPGEYARYYGPCPRLHIVLHV